MLARLNETGPGKVTLKTMVIDRQASAKIEPGQIVRIR